MRRPASRQGDRGEDEGDVDHHLLESVSSEVAASLTGYEVDRRVNNSRTVDPADPGLIEPLAG